jgi:hypothetical protein
MISLYRIKGGERRAATFAWGSANVSERSGFDQGK